MDSEIKAKLAAKGVTAFSLQEGLGFTDEEYAEVEARAALRIARQNIATLVQIKRKRKFTQNELAARLKTTQPMIARIESARDNVSLDLLVRAAIAAGANLQDIAKSFADAGMVAQ